jgi:hypothetical protein
MTMGNRIKAVDPAVYEFMAFISHCPLRPKRLRAWEIQYLTEYTCGRKYYTPARHKAETSRLVATQGH